MNDATQELRPVFLSPDGRLLHLLDQRALPQEERWMELSEIEEVALAIESLAVRGAPAIGCAAAMGLAAASFGFADESFDAQVETAIERLARTRPTAVNLFVALEQMREANHASIGAKGDARRQVLVARAIQHARVDLDACKAMGAHGAGLMPAQGGVLTHCNTGALATAGWGTALGVIRSAHEAGKEFCVYANETRPLLQGARLTAWELVREGIGLRVITDSMAGAMMQAGRIQAVIVGADRIAANGDAANKIGTYTLAVLAKFHEIPFYVAAPWTTVDIELADGSQIPIEERDGEEVRRHGGELRTPVGVPVCNPAFDVTPAVLITRIVTETGVFLPSDLAAAHARALNA